MGSINWVSSASSSLHHRAPLSFREFASNAELERAINSAALVEDASPADAFDDDPPLVGTVPAIRRFPAWQWLGGLFHHRTSGQLGAGALGRLKNASSSCHIFLSSWQPQLFLFSTRYSLPFPGFYRHKRSLRKTMEWQTKEADFLCWHRRAHREPGAVCCCNVSCLELMFLFIQEIPAEAKSQFIHIFASDGNRPPDIILS